MKFLHGIFAAGIFALAADQTKAEQIWGNQELEADEMVDQMLNLVDESPQEEVDLIKISVSQKGVQKIAKEVGDVQKLQRNMKPDQKLNRLINKDFEAISKSKQFQRLMRKCQKIAKNPRAKKDVMALKHQMEHIKKMEMDMWKGKKHCSKQENQQGKDFWIQVNNKNFNAYNKEIEKMAAMEKEVLSHPWAKNLRKRLDAVVDSKEFRKLDHDLQKASKGQQYQQMRKEYADVLKELGQNVKLSDLPAGFKKTIFVHKVELFIELAIEMMNGKIREVYDDIFEEVTGEDSDESD